LGFTIIFKRLDMKFSLTYILLICCSFQLFAQQTNSFVSDTIKGSRNLKFEKLVLKYNLEFRIPSNFKQVKVRKRKLDLYQNVIRHVNEDFEIRYAILELSIDSNSSLRNTSWKWESLAKNQFEKMVAGFALNSFTSIAPTIAYNPLNTNIEYHADWGETISFVPNSSFGGKYKNCIAKTIIKDSTCQIIIFFMFQDLEKQHQLLKNSLFSIKFKNNENRKEKLYSYLGKESYPGEHDFYINSTFEYLLIRTDNKKIKNAYFKITDNFGKVYFDGKLDKEYFYLYDLPKGFYKLRIDYDGKEIRRIVEKF
jgi:hypothetical protein